MALWTPANLSVAPRMWLNGDNAVFSGSNLSSIANSGSEGGSFVLGSVPTKQTTNSLNGILLTGTSQYLSLTMGAFSSGAIHIFALVNLNSRAGINTGLLRRYDLFTDHCIDFQPDGDEFGGQNLFGDEYGSGTPVPGIAGYPGASLGVGTPGSVQGGLGATTNTYRLNGTNIAGGMTSTTGALEPGASTTWYVGQEWGGMGTRFEGAVYQLLVLDYQPTLADLQRLEGWAHWKYGVQAALPGGHPYAGAAPTTGGTYTLTATVGTFALTGQAAAFRRALKLVTIKGTFAETGNAANLSRGLKLPAASGAFTQTGVAAVLRSARKLVTTAGAFALTGNAANLVYKPVGSTYILTASTGSFALTGKAAGLKVGYKLPAAKGAFTYSGLAANLARGRTLAAGMGAFTLTGQAVGLARTYGLAAECGTFSLIGNAARLHYSNPQIWFPVAQHAVVWTPVPLAAGPEG